MKFIKQMKSIGGCQPALDWAEGKTFEEAYETSQWGEWMGFTFNGVNPGDIRSHKVAAKCALVVKNKMNNEAIELCNKAIAFSESSIDTLDLMRVKHLAKKDAIIDIKKRNEMTQEQCANNAAKLCLSGNISAACYWAAGAGDEVYIQAKCADIIRKELPKETWNL